MLKGINKPILNQAQARKKAIHDQRKPYEKVAEGMEAQFISHMLTELKKTAPSATAESQAQKIYSSLLDTERSEAMSKQGLGIKKMVLSQMLPEHLKYESERVVRTNPNPEIKKYQNPYEQNRLKHGIKMRAVQGESNE